MKYCLIISFVCLLSACNDRAQQNEQNKTTEAISSANNPTTTSSSVEQQSMDTGAGCYMKVTGRDTAIIMLDQKGIEFSGEMLYDNYEKDGSRGTVKGKRDGDILKLFYEFNSEGMHSVMEVYFKKVPGGLLRGIGDMNVKGDTAYFTSGINYSDKEAFSKIDCNSIKGNF